MIELVAHRDNSWPGAYRIHMKDSGMLLGVGQDVKAVAVMRLLEEGMEGTFHVAFASGKPGMRGKVEALDWDAEIDAIKAEVIAEHEKAAAEADEPVRLKAGETVFIPKTLDLEKAWAKVTKEPASSPKKPVKKAKGK